MAGGSRAETQHPPLQGASSFLLLPFPSPPSFFSIHRTEPGAGAERAQGEEKRTALRGSPEPGKGWEGEPRAGVSLKATRDPQSLPIPLSVHPTSRPLVPAPPSPSLCSFYFVAFYSVPRDTWELLRTLGEPRGPVQGARERDGEPEARAVSRGWELAQVAPHSAAEWRRRASGPG